MNSLNQRFTNFWLPDGDANNLGICRFLFFLTIFLVYGLFYNGLNFTGTNWGLFWQWARLPDSLWLPVSFLRVFSSPPLHPETAQILEKVFYVGCLVTAFGFFSRTASAVTALSFALLTAYRVSFGDSAHRDLLPVLIALVFALSRCGDGFSIDSWIQGRWRNRRPNSLSAHSFEYGWPIRLIQVMMIFTFFAAGISKLRVSGLEWVLSPTVSNYMLESYYTGEIDAFSTRLGLGLTLARFPVIGSILAAIGLLIELLSPLALFRRFRWFILLLFFFQIGIHLTVSRHFECYLAAYSCWIPWQKFRFFRKCFRTSSEKR